MGCAGDWRSPWTPVRVARLKAGRKLLCRWADGLLPPYNAFHRCGPTAGVEHRRAVTVKIREPDVARRFSEEFHGL